MVNNFIEEHIEGAYALTNNSVDNIRQDEKFNQNHLAKCLMHNIETYKRIIDKLLINKKEYEVMKQLQNNSK